MAWHGGGGVRITNLFETAILFVGLRFQNSDIDGLKYFRFGLNCCFMLTMIGCLETRDTEKMESDEKRGGKNTCFGMEPFFFCIEKGSIPH